MIFLAKDDEQLPDCNRLSRKCMYFIGFSVLRPNNALFRRSADFECAPGSSPEHIDFPRIDNIRHYLEAEIVNVY